MKGRSFTVPERWAQVHAAQSRHPADLLIRGCRIVNVYSAEVHPGDIAVKDGIIVAIRDGYDGEAAVTIPGNGRFAVPGLVVSYGLPDSHPTPGPDEGNLGLAAGVTSIICDLTAGDGETVRELPQRQWTATRLGVRGPSQVPAVARSSGEAVASLRSGFPTFLQPGEGRDTVGEILGKLRQIGVDVSRLCLGRWDPTTGGMRAAVGLARDVMRDAPRIGLSPAEACALATLNPAIVFGLEHRLGSITPGRFADFWLTEALDSTDSIEVFINGRML